MDGTIVDTEPVAAEVVIECFENWGFELSPDDATHVTGRTWVAALEHLFSKYPPNIPMGEATQKILSLYRARIEKNLTVIPGAVDAVKTLARRYPLALVSGSRREEILLILKKLGILDRFKLVLGAEDYEKSKPSPDSFRRAMTSLRTTPERGLVFEDSPAGIQAALSAGLNVVAISSTNHFKLDTSRAHRQIKNFLAVDTDWTIKIASELIK